MNANTSYRTLQNNSTKYMLKCVEEYEQVRDKAHPTYKTARSFFAAKSICYQNFYKFYSRYKAAQLNSEFLLPLRRGPKPKYREMPLVDDSLDAKILKHRAKGYNKHIISEALKKELGPKAKKCSASTVYRVLRRYGEARLSRTVIENKRKIVREKAGSLAHIDCHYLPKGIVKSEPLKKYFVMGVIDDYSRIVWTEIMPSHKALDATFAMMDAILIMDQRYGIKFEEALTDNGPEFCGSLTNPENHAFERLLMYFGIRHLRTQAYRPQTNGKIERFWRTFHDEVIEGAVFNTLDELKDAVLGYNFYHNEHRPHQGIEGKKPLSMLGENEKTNLITMETTK